VPLARRLGLPIAVAPEFDEIDFGDWTGRAFDELQREQPQRWQAWVQRRGSATAPGGEAFAAVQQRALAGVQRLRRAHAGGSALVVSHGDVIKSVLAHFLGMSLDALESFTIDCASVSEVALGERWAQVKCVNDVAGLRRSPE
jgi:broad specificity phosphatase PhoE